MEMKKLFVFAAATAMLAGCANDDYVGQNENLTQETVKAINFSSANKVLSRADKTGADAATALENNFVVYGFKGTALNASTTTFTTVFDHYNVNYAAGTANSTTSNTKDWEYVGQDHNIKGTSPASALGSATEQTIKYWDHSAANYHFIATSLGKGTGTPATYATLSAINTANLGKATSTGTPVYTLTGSLAELNATYVADIVTKKGSAEYTNEVTPKFRSLGAKIRIALYETVPGYAVSGVNFYTSATDASPSTKGALYAASDVLNAATAKGAMQVYYPNIDPSETATYGKPQVKFVADASSAKTSIQKFNDAVITYTANLAGATGDAYLGVASNTASYVGNKDYTVVLPTGAGQALTLKVDYTLTSTDGSGEVINVKGATAEVPAVYTAWQPNYAYTYLFKISQDTNGSTGGSVTGLYPITFDAVVTETEDGIQETITTVSTPSITTYGKGTNGVSVTNSNEYKKGQNIYAVVGQGTALTVGTNAALYTAALETGAAQVMTESAIANALVNYTSETADDANATAKTVIAAGGTPGANEIEVGTSVADLYTQIASGEYAKCEAGAVAVLGTTYYSIDAAKITGYVIKDANGKKLTVTKATGLTAATTIAAADSPTGNAITVNNAYFKPTTAGTYVFEYNDGTKKHYKIIKVVD